jgi:hypothetical protein
MTAAKKPKTSKNRYAVMIPRTQVYCFEVEAKSAEDACKALWRKLRLDNSPTPPADAALVTSTWNEAQKHDEWIIAGGALPEVTETSKSASAWNGEEIVRIKLA